MFRGRRVVEEPCAVEVEQHGSAVLVDETFDGLYVAVDDFCVVQGSKRLSNVTGDLPDPARRRTMLIVE